MLSNYSAKISEHAWYLTSICSSHSRKNIRSDAPLERARPQNHSPEKIIEAARKIPRVRKALEARKKRIIDPHSS